MSDVSQTLDILADRVTLRASKVQSWKEQGMPAPLLEWAKQLLEEAEEELKQFAGQNNIPSEQVSELLKHHASRVLQYENAKERYESSPISEHIEEIRQILLSVLLRLLEKEDKEQLYSQYLSKGDEENVCRADKIKKEVFPECQRLVELTADIKAWAITVCQLDNDT